MNKDAVQHMGLPTVFSIFEANFSRIFRHQENANQIFSAQLSIKSIHVYGNLSNCSNQQAALVNLHLGIPQINSRQQVYKSGAFKNQQISQLIIADVDKDINLNAQYNYLLDHLIKDLGQVAYRGLQKKTPFDLFIQSSISSQTRARENWQKIKDFINRSTKKVLYSFVIANCPKINVTAQFIQQRPIDQNHESTNSSKELIQYQSYQCPTYTFSFSELQFMHLDGFYKNNKDRMSKPLHLYLNKGMDQIQNINNYQKLSKSSQSIINELQGLCEDQALFRYLNIPKIQFSQDCGIFSQRYKDVFFFQVKNFTFRKDQSPSDFATRIISQQKNSYNYQQNCLNISQFELLTEQLVQQIVKQQINSQQAQTFQNDQVFGIQNLKVALLNLNGLSQTSLAVQFKRLDSFIEIDLIKQILEQVTFAKELKQPMKQITKYMQHASKAYQFQKQGRKRKRAKTTHQIQLIPLVNVEEVSIKLVHLSSKIIQQSLLYTEQDAKYEEYLENNLEMNQNEYQYKQPTHRIPKIKVLGPVRLFLFQLTCNDTNFIKDCVRMGEVCGQLKSLTDANCKFKWNNLDFNQINQEVVVIQRSIDELLYNQPQRETEAKQQNKLESENQNELSTQDQLSNQLQQISIKQIQQNISRVQKQVEHLSLENEQQVLKGSRQFVQLHVTDKEVQGIKLSKVEIIEDEDIENSPESQDLEIPSFKQPGRQILLSQKSVIGRGLEQAQSWASQLLPLQKTQSGVTQLVRQLSRSMSGRPQSTREAEIIAIKEALGKSPQSIVPALETIPARRQFSSDDKEQIGGLERQPNLAKSMELEKLRNVNNKSEKLNQSKLDKPGVGFNLPQSHSVELPTKNQASDQDMMQQLYNQKTRKNFQRLDSDLKNSKLALSIDLKSQSLQSQQNQAFNSSSFQKTQQTNISQNTLSELNSEDAKQNAFWEDQENDLDNSNSEIETERRESGGAAIDDSTSPVDDSHSPDDDIDMVCELSNETLLVVLQIFTELKPYLKNLKSNKPDQNSGVPESKESSAKGSRDSQNALPQIIPNQSKQQHFQKTIPGSAFQIRENINIQNQSGNVNPKCVLLILDQKIFAKMQYGFSEKFNVRFDQATLRIQTPHFGMQMTNLYMEIQRKMTEQVNPSFNFGYVQLNEGEQIKDNYQEFCKTSNFLIRVCKPLKNVSVMKQFQASIQNQNQNQNLSPMSSFGREFQAQPKTLQSQKIEQVYEKMRPIQKDYQKNFSDSLIYKNLPTFFEDSWLEKNISHLESIDYIQDTIYKRQGATMEGSTQKQNYNLKLPYTKYPSTFVNIEIDCMKASLPYKYQLGRIIKNVTLWSKSLTEILKQEFKIGGSQNSNFKVFNQQQIVTIDVQKSQVQFEDHKFENALAKLQPIWGDFRALDLAFQFRKKKMEKNYVPNQSQINTFREVLEEEIMKNIYGESPKKNRRKKGQQKSSQKKQGISLKDKGTKDTNFEATNQDLNSNLTSQVSLSTEMLQQTQKELHQQSLENREALRNRNANQQGNLSDEKYNDVLVSIPGGKQASAAFGKLDPINEKNEASSPLVTPSNPKPDIAQSNSASSGGKNSNQSSLRNTQIKKSDDNLPGIADNSKGGAGPKEIQGESVLSRDTSLQRENSLQEDVLSNTDIQDLVSINKQISDTSQGSATQGKKQEQQLQDDQGANASQQWKSLLNFKNIGQKIAEKNLQRRNDMSKKRSSTRDRSNYDLLSTSQKIDPKAQFGRMNQQFSDDTYRNFSRKIAKAYVNLLKNLNYDIMEEWEYMMESKEAFMNSDIFSEDQANEIIKAMKSIKRVDGLLNFIMEEPMKFIMAQRSHSNTDAKYGLDFVARVDPFSKNISQQIQQFQHIGIFHGVTKIYVNGQLTDQPNIQMQACSTRLNLCRAVQDTNYPIQVLKVPQLFGMYNNYLVEQFQSRQYYHPPSKQFSHNKIEISGFSIAIQPSLFHTMQKVQKLFKFVTPPTFINLIGQQIVQKFDPEIAQKFVLMGTDAQHHTQKSLLDMNLNGVKITCEKVKPLTFSHKQISNVFKSKYSLDTIHTQSISDINRTIATRDTSMQLRTSDRDRDVFASTHTSRAGSIDPFETSRRSRNLSQSTDPRSYRSQDLTQRLNTYRNFSQSMRQVVQQGSVDTQFTKDSLFDTRLLQESQQRYDEQFTMQFEQIVFKFGLNGPQSKEPADMLHFKLYGFTIDFDQFVDTQRERIKSHVLPIAKEIDLFKSQQGIIMDKKLIQDFELDIEQKSQHIWNDRTQHFKFVNIPFLEVELLLGYETQSKIDFRNHYLYPTIPYQTNSTYLKPPSFKSTSQARISNSNRKSDQGLNITQQYAYEYPKPIEYASILKSTGKSVSIDCSFSHQRDISKFNEELLIQEFEEQPLIYIGEYQILFVRKTLEYFQKEVALPYFSNPLQHNLKEIKEQKSLIPKVQQTNNPQMQKVTVKNFLPQVQIIHQAVETQYNEDHSHDVRVTIKLVYLFLIMEQLQDDIKLSPNVPGKVGQVGGKNQTEPKDLALSKIDVKVENFKIIKYDLTKSVKKSRRNLKFIDEMVMDMEDDKKQNVQNLQLDDALDQNCLAFIKQVSVQSTEIPPPRQKDQGYQRSQQTFEIIIRDTKLQITDKGRNSLIAFGKHMMGAVGHPSSTMSNIKEIISNLNKQLNAQKHISKRTVLQNFDPDQKQSSWPRSKSEIKIDEQKESEDQKEGGDYKQGSPEKGFESQNIPKTSSDHDLYKQSENEKGQIQNQDKSNDAEKPRQKAKTLKEISTSQAKEQSQTQYQRSPSDMSEQGSGVPLQEDKKQFEEDQQASQAHNSIQSILKEQPATKSSKYLDISESFKRKDVKKDDTEKPEKGFFPELKRSNRIAHQPSLPRVSEDIQYSEEKQPDEDVDKRSSSPINNNQQEATQPTNIDDQSDFSNDVTALKRTVTSQLWEDTIQEQIQNQQYDAKQQIRINVDGFQAHFIFENDSILLHAPFGTLDINDLYDKKLTKISFSQVSGHVHTSVIDPDKGLFWFPHPYHGDATQSIRNMTNAQNVGGLLSDYRGTEALRSGEIGLSDIGSDILSDDGQSMQKPSIETILDPFEIVVQVIEINQEKVAQEKAIQLGKQSSAKSNQSPNTNELIPQTNISINITNIQGQLSSKEYQMVQQIVQNTLLGPNPIVILLPQHKKVKAAFLEDDKLRNQVYEIYSIQQNIFDFQNLQLQQLSVLGQSAILQNEGDQFSSLEDFSDLSPNNYVIELINDISQLYLGLIQGLKHRFMVTGLKLEDRYKEMMKNDFLKGKNLKKSIVSKQMEIQVERAAWSLKGLVDQQQNAKTQTQEKLKDIILELKDIEFRRVETESQASEAEFNIYDIASYVLYTTDNSFRDPKTGQIQRSIDRREKMISKLFQDRGESIFTALLKLEPPTPDQYKYQNVEVYLRPLQFLFDRKTVKSIQAYFNLPQDQQSANQNVSNVQQANSQKQLQSEYKDLIGDDQPQSNINSKLQGKQKMSFNKMTQGFVKALSRNRNKSTTEPKPDVTNKAVTVSINQSQPPSPQIKDAPPLIGSKQKKDKDKSARQSTQGRSYTYLFDKIKLDQIYVEIREDNVLMVARWAVQVLQAFAQNDTISMSRNKDLKTRVFKLAARQYNDLRVTSWRDLIVKVVLDTFVEWFSRQKPEIKKMVQSKEKELDE